MGVRTGFVITAEACGEKAGGSAGTAWQTCGNTILGWVMGLGVVIAIIAILIIAGKMVQANFTGDPWIAARGMGELPWVLLGIVLLLVAAPLTAVLLQGARPDNGPSVWQVYLEQNAPAPRPRDERPATPEPQDEPPELVDI